jgi:hypothetical protein
MTDGRYHWRPGDGVVVFLVTRLLWARVLRKAWFPC